MMFFIITLCLKKIYSKQQYVGITLIFLHILIKHFII